MKISCNVIKDLMPSYIDEICSEESRRLVDEHIINCKRCQMTMQSMKKEVPAFDQLDALEADYLKKVKQHYNRINMVSFIIILVCILCVVAAVYRNTYTFSYYFIMIIGAVLMLASFFIRGNKITKSKKEFWSRIAALILLLYEIGLMIFVIGGSFYVLPYAVSACIKVQILIILVVQMLAWIYVMVKGARRDEDYTVRAIIHITGAMFAVFEMVFRSISLPAGMFAPMVISIQAGVLIEGLLAFLGYRIWIWTGEKKGGKKHE